MDSTVLSLTYTIVASIHFKVCCDLKMENSMDISFSLVIVDAVTRILLFFIP